MSTAKTSQTFMNIFTESGMLRTSATLKFSCKEHEPVRLENQITMNLELDGDPIEVEVTYAQFCYMQKKMRLTSGPSLPEMIFSVSLTGLVATPYRFHKI